MARHFDSLAGVLPTPDPFTDNCRYNMSDPLLSRLVVQSGDGRLAHLHPSDFINQELMILVKEILGWAILCTNSVNG